MATIVEFTGLTGSGKTTLMAAAKDQLSDRGITALDAYDVVLAHYGLNFARNSKLRSVLIDLVSFPPFLSYASTRSGMELMRLAFRVIKRDSGGILVAFNLGRNLAKRIGVHMLLMRFRHELDNRSLVVCDEGTLHIAHNLFVRSDLPPDLREIERFSGLVPMSDKIIWIKAPMDQSLESILQRGHSRVEDSTNAAKSFVVHGYKAFNVLCSQKAVQDRLFMVENSFSNGYDKSSSIENRAQTISAFLGDLARSLPDELTLRAPRIAIVSSTPYAPPWSEGVRNLIQGIAHDFSLRGSAVTVVGPDSPMAMERGDSDERVINVGTLDKWPKWLRILGQIEVWLASAKAVRKLDPEPDVLLLVASLTSALGLRTLLYRALCRKPLAIYVTGLGRPRIGYKRGLRVDHVFVGSEFLKQWFPDADVILPFLPISFTPSDAVHERSEGVFTVLFLGSFEPERGVEYLLRAISIARQKIEGGIKLILAWNGSGASNHETIQRLISALDIRSIVDMRGHVDTNHVYREADIVVIPRASQERMASPVRIVEALNMHKPMIVSRICGMEKLVEGCGLAVEPRDEGALAGAILKLAQDETLRSQLEANCSEVARLFDRHLVLDTLFNGLSTIEA